MDFFEKFVMAMLVSLRIFVLRSQECSELFDCDKGQIAFKIRPDINHEKTSQNNIHIINILSLTNLKTAGNAEDAPR